MMKRKKKAVDPLADLITPAEAARVRGVTRATMAHLMGRGRFRTREIGGRVFVYRSEVEDFVPATGGRPRKIETGNKGGRKR